MENLNESDAICSRIINKADGEDIHIYIWAPVSFPDLQGDFKCFYKITGIGSGMVSHALGVDSIQAIYLALKSIGTIIYTSEFAKDNKLSWMNSCNNLGFPVPDSMKKFIPDK